MNILQMVIVLIWKYDKIIVGVTKTVERLALDGGIVFSLCPISIFRLIPD